MFSLLLTTDIFFKIITNKTLELNLETSTALSQLEE